VKRYNFLLDIPSESKPDKTYSIKMDEQGNLTCPCPIWVFNRRGNRTCKHTDIVKRAGFNGSKGKFLVLVDVFRTKVPVYCKNYPELCDECELRFSCWTDEKPEFELGALRKAGVV